MDESKILKSEKLDWHKLQPWQPEGLKKTTPKLLDKLKRSILKYGLGSPFYIWERKNSLNIIDGHHRLMALKSLEDDGHKLPEMVDCIWLDLKNEEEAKRAILIFNSHYAQFEKPGYRDFISDMDILEIDLNFQPFRVGFDHTENEHIIGKDPKKCPHCGMALNTKPKKAKGQKAG